MNKATNNDLLDLSDILEGFNLKKEKMTEADLIDLAARLKPAAKSIKSIDEYVKELVKTKLHHKDGVRKGTVFRAVLKLIPCKRLDQSALKDEDPETYAAYLKESDDERVTFEAR